MLGHVHSIWSPSLDRPYLLFLLIHHRLLQRFLLFLHTLILVLPQHFPRFPNVPIVPMIVPLYRQAHRQKLSADSLPSPWSLKSKAPRTRKTPRRDQPDKRSRNIVMVEEQASGERQRIGRIGFDQAAERSVGAVHCEAVRVVVREREASGGAWVGGNGVWISTTFRLLKGRLMKRK
jgi:hypothetical protein